MLIGERVGVFHKFIDHIRRGWQTDQVEVDPPDQRSTISLRARLEPGIVQAGEDEGINGISQPVDLCIGDSRNSGKTQRLERPPIGRIGVFAPGRITGPVGTIVDPASQLSNFFRSEWISLRRHLQP